MVDMPGIFERFLTAALKTELEQHAGSVHAPKHATLDTNDQIAMYPDITQWSGGTCCAVIDARYKRVKNDDYPNADAYQMLAYCTQLGLKEGWLVYADLDGREAQSQVIRQAGITLRVEALDLAGSIDDLNASIASLVERIRISVLEATR